MPKERRSRASFDRPSPFPSRSSDPQRRRSPGCPSKDLKKKKKEWDEMLCPVCMDHPHNAVLLICSSSKKGCRLFMCNTSHRHSNCLDQYRRATTKTPEGGSRRSELFPCPLCRGSISGWKAVDEAARKYLNAKARNCSAESCGFRGDYSAIRRHSRREHPLIRPSETDPERQQDWRRLEEELALDDLNRALEEPDEEEYALFYS